MGKKNAVSVERKFLHDIATPISIVKLVSRRLLRMCNERGGDEVERQLLEKISDAVAAMEDLHASRKAQIHETKAA